MNFTDQTPSQIDLRMTELGMKLADLRFTAQRYTRLLESGSLLPYKVTEYEAKVADTIAASTPVLAELSAIDGEFVARGGWTRYFLVTNVGGHVHTSRSCSTCRSTTEFELVWQFSGSTAEELVEVAGERACTVCFPEAPVATRTRTSNLPYDVEARRIADEKAEAKKVAAAAKDAKNLLAPVKLSGRFGDTVKTLRAAQIAATDALVSVAERATTPNKDAVRRYITDYRILATAIAAKQGTTVEEVGAELAPKVAKKVKANAKAAEKFRATHSWMFEDAE